MIEGGGHPGQTVLVLGVLTVAAMLAKAGMGRVGLPSLIALLRRWPQAAPNDTGS